MATRKPFGNRISEEGKAANAKAAAATKPAPTARPKTAEKPSTRSTPSSSTATKNQPAPSTKKTPSASTAISDASGMSETEKLLKGKENAQTFLGIISNPNLPPEAKNRYLSAFTDFLALDPQKQADYLSGIDAEVKGITEKKFTQDRTRLKEDFDYEVEKREREKADLKSTFDKVVGHMDFNKNRDIAKENQTAAKAMQNVGNTAFVTGVAGSGIFSRRTFYVRENLQNNTEDINIDFNQNKSQLELKKSQADRTIDDEIDRLYDLNERDVSDLDQSQKEDELSLFLELAGNKFGEKGEQNRQLLEAGAGSAAEDFAAGGDDSARKTRDTKQKTAARLEAQRAREDQAVTRYQQLYSITKALETMGRNAEIPGIRAEMDRLRPDVESVLDEARNGYTRGEYAENGLSARSFLGNSGSGIGSLEDFQRRWDTQFYESNNLLYKGMNEEARKRLNEVLKGNADTVKMYNP